MHSQKVETKPLGLGNVGLERLDRRLIRPEGPIILDACIQAPEPELVVPDGKVRVLVELEEVLRTAERYGRARVERKIAREGKRDIGEGLRGIAERVQRRADGRLAKRLMQLNKPIDRARLADPAVSLSDLAKP